MTAPRPGRTDAISTLRRVVAVGLLGITLVLAGCASVRAPNTYLANLGLNSRPTVDDFDACDGAGCRSISGLGYTETEWRDIAAVFEPLPNSPPEERARIELAIGAMETIIGKKNGTLGDAPKNKRRLGTGKQLDCIAEAANTTVALLLLEQEGLLRYHDVGHPQHRGFAQFRFPHNAASLVERRSGEHYAVDSWFFAGGEAAVCVPLDRWRSGYDPYKDSPEIGTVDDAP
jgi:hypothetical protein